MVLKGARVPAELKKHRFYCFFRGRFPRAVFHCFRTTFTSIWDLILALFSLNFRIAFASYFCMRFYAKSEAKPPPQGGGAGGVGDGSRT